MVGIVFIQALPDRDWGTILGKLDRGHKGDVVWLMTGDCLKSYEALTDSGGRFIFSRLPPGTYKLMASGLNMWQDPTKDIFLRPGATVEMNLITRGEDEGEIEAPVLSPLHGLIVDSQNRPVWGATITDFDAHETRSGNDGRFGFCSIDSGREYGLTVTHPDYETQKVPLAAGAGRYSDGKLKIVLQRRKDR